MSAAPPGTETLIIPTGDGATLAVTLRYDADTRAWSDPAATVDGAGAAVLCLDLGTGTGGALVPVHAGIPVAAAVLGALGLPSRENLVIGLARDPMP